MLRKKKPSKYEKSVQVEISASPEQVFKVIDPASPDSDLIQSGFSVTSNPDAEDSFFAQHPDSPSEYSEIVVTERIVPERLVLDTERRSETQLFGSLLGANSEYKLCPSDNGGTTLELLECALFHPNTKEEELEMEHNMYNMLINIHLKQVRSYCELSPEENEHHYTYRLRKFWDWFVDNEQSLHSANADSIDLLDSLGKQLGLASANLSFEMRTLNDNIRELVIHADGMKSGFASVENMVSIAPVEALPGWQIVAFKQPKGELTGKGFVESGSFDVNSIRYKLDPINEHGTRDITLFFETYTRRSHDKHIEQGFFVLDHCLGEYRTATEIGEIELAALTKAGDGAKPINSLAGEFT